MACRTAGGVSSTLANCAHQRHVPGSASSWAFFVAIFAAFFFASAIAAVVLFLSFVRCAFVFFFGIIDGLRKPEAPSLYAQGAGIQTARRAQECVSSRDTYSSHWFGSRVSHLLVLSADAPGGKGARGRVPSSAQRSSAYDAPCWHRRTRYDLSCSQQTCDPAEEAVRALHR